MLREQLLLLQHLDHCFRVRGAVSVKQLVFVKSDHLFAPLVRAEVLKLMNWKCVEKLVCDHKHGRDDGRV